MQNSSINETLPQHQEQIFNTGFTLGISFCEYHSDG